MEKTVKKKSVWGWIFSSLFLLVALITIFSSFLAALALIVAAFFIFPPTVGMLKKKWNLEFSRKVKIVIGIVGVILFFFLVGGSDVETVEIKIEKGDSDPKEVVEATQTIIDVVDDFQDAQLSTIALLSVKFETADKDEYLKYIKEVEDKWEKVEKSAKELEKIKEKGAGIPPVSSTGFNLASIARADYPDEIEFNNDAMNSDDLGGGEIDLGSQEKEVFHDNIVGEARAIKSLYPNGTAIGYLMDHLGITAKEAQKVIEDYYGNVKKDWDDTAAVYDAASKMAQGIAYGSKVSLYVLGTVSSFGAAAAAETGGTVILGYMGGAWGAALGGADIALDIAEGASIVSTGEGLNHYKKNKEFIGKANTVFAIFNVGKMAALGIPKFNGSAFENADDLMSVYGTGELAYNMATEKKGEKLLMKVGKGVKFPQGTPIGEIVKHYHKKGFEYNKVALVATVDEKGDITVQEVDVSGADESCQSSDQLIQLIENEESHSLDFWWPACKQGAFSKPSCRHLPNTCSYKGKCICKEGYAGIPNKNDVLVACVTNEEFAGLMGQVFGRIAEKNNAEACARMKEYKRAEDIVACRGGSFTPDPELEKRAQELNSPELEQQMKKFMKCDL